MSSAEKADKIVAILVCVFPQPDIPLGHVDPFTVLVAVVLSAQSTDAQVNRVTPALFRRAATPAAIARMPEHEPLNMNHRSGLAPNKTRHIRRPARRHVEDYGGNVTPAIHARERL